MRQLRITRIYLEVCRGGHYSNLETLRSARDFFRQNGIETAGGITTTPGPGYGVPSNRSRFSMNYEAPETLSALRETAERTASEFDEFIVDDFLMTSDESELSVKAKGDRSWSLYRLELMTRIARDCIIHPARTKNPGVKITIKYPQWYDRFHVYGYNVITEPEMFDRVWVGTETRDPETPRFGYTQPTEGFINYSWLASLAGQKIGGAWFDTIECSADHFLMQAYQSILAGAKEITLFNLEDVVSGSPPLSRFRERRDSLDQLAALVGDRKNRGVMCYKPPHSDPGRDIYLFDFLAVLGIPVEMTGRAPEQVDTILLTAHSASDPEIVTRAKKWAQAGAQVAATPGFMEAAARMTGSPVEEGLFRLVEISTLSDEEFSPAREMFLTPVHLPIPEWTKEKADEFRGQFSLPIPCKVEGAPPFGLHVFGKDTLVLSNFRPEPKKVAFIFEHGKTAQLDLDDRFHAAEGAVVSVNGSTGWQVTVPAWDLVVLRATF
jgi:hypothetical protein